MIGLDILRQGGNTIDAGVAVGLTLQDVIAPPSSGSNQPSAFARNWRLPRPATDAGHALHSA